MPVFRTAACALLLLAAGPAWSDRPTVLDSRIMSMELASDIAAAAVAACRRDGYQVSAIVVDRSGTPVALLRDALASGFTIPLAHGKANAVVLSGIASAEFRRTRQDIRPEINRLDNVLMLEGGLPVRAAGTLLGAVGVSGAPGGDKDEACAQAAIESVTERLEFAD